MVRFSLWITLLAQGIHHITSRVLCVGCCGLDHLPRVHQEQTDGYGAALRTTPSSEGDLIPWKFLKRCRDIKMHV